MKGRAYIHISSFMFHEAYFFKIYPVRVILNRQTEIIQSKNITKHRDRKVTRKKQSQRSFRRCWLNLPKVYALSQICFVFPNFEPVCTSKTGGDLVFSKQKRGDQEKKGHGINKNSLFSPLIYRLEERQRGFGAPGGRDRRGRGWWEKGWSMTLGGQKRSANKNWGWRRFVFFLLWLLLIPIFDWNTADEDSGLSGNWGKDGKVMGGGRWKRLQTKTWSL